VREGDHDPEHGNYLVDRLGGYREKFRLVGGHEGTEMSAAMAFYLHYIAHASFVVA
jgi:hypothetical protein